MTERTRVAFVAADLGLGGTGKGVVSFATRLDPTRFSPRVITWNGGGPREKDLLEARVPVSVGCNDADALARALLGSDVVHVFRHGIADPLVPTAAARAAVPILIESNIFGARDRSSDEARFACHLFGSMMCLNRYRSQVGADRQFDARHRVLYFPPEADRLRRMAPDPKDGRRVLGLDPNRPVVTRVGRADDLKWRDLIVDMVPHLKRLVPDVQVLLVGATPRKRARLERRGLMGQVHLMDPVAGDASLATIYAASDVVVNASMIGESQGLVIAEAMALGIPVVTCSTPWVDNAQVEFVINGKTGWVANHPHEFAEAVADLLLNHERRAEFGERGREDIAKRLDPQRLTHQLETLYEHFRSGTDVSWSPTAADAERFARQYRVLARSSYRPATLRERTEAMLMRAREETLRRSASARMAAATLRRPRAR